MSVLKNQNRNASSVQPSAENRYSQHPDDRSCPYTLFIASLLLIALAAIAGCSDAASSRPPVFPVTGQVTWNGKPLPNAYVTLHPRQPSDPNHLSARGHTDATGKFQVTSYEENDGAAAGEYAVTVEYYPLIKQGESYLPGPNLLPPKIANATTTDIVVRVADGTNELPPIQLRR